MKKIQAEKYIVYNTIYIKLQSMPTNLQRQRISDCPDTGVEGAWSERGPFRVREMLVTVTVVMVSQAHSYIHADQIIHFTCVHFSGAVRWWGESLHPKYYLLFS